MKYIDDATDLTQHQTGDAAAQAIANSKMDEIYQKYTSPEYANMPINELAYNLKRDTGNTIAYSDRLRTELNQADDQVKNLKQIYPHLDFEGLRKTVRADVVNRNLKPDSHEFSPEVQPSTIDISDPSFLGKFLTNTKNLDDAIANPKGLDPMTVAAGDPYTNVEYQAKVPFWAQTNFDEGKMKNGFLPKGFMPSLSPKLEDLPSDFLPALKDSPRKMVTSDVHRQFYDQFPVEVEKGTRDMFGDSYDNMSPHEKELAQRDFLATKVTALDKSNFAYKSSKTPSVSQQRFWINPTGTKSGSGSGYGAVEGNAFDTFPDARSTKGTFNTKGGVFYDKDGKPYNGPSVFITSKDIPTKILSALKAGGIDPKFLLQGVRANVKNGILESISNDLIGTISRDDMENIYQRKMDTERKGEQGLRFGENGNSQQSAPQSKSEQSDGYSRSELKQAGWSDAQINTAVKAGKIKVHD